MFFHFNFFLSIASFAFRPSRSGSVIHRAYLTCSPCKSSSCSFFCSLWARDWPACRFVRIIALSRPFSLPVSDPVYDGADADSTADAAADEAAPFDLEALTALRAQMESRLDDCGVVIEECDAVLKEAKKMEENSDKRARKK